MTRRLSVYTLTKRACLSLCCLLLGLFVLLGASPALPATPSQAKVYRLSFAGCYPDEHPVVRKVLIPWTHKIAQKTQNRLIISYYSPDTFAPAATHFIAMQHGSPMLSQQSAHWADGLTGQSSAKLLLSKYLSIPNKFSSSREASTHFWRSYNSSPDLRKEYADFKVLALYGSAPVQLHLTFQLKDLSELRGKRIICHNDYLAAMLRGNGATVLSATLNDQLGLLAGGEADGCTLPFDSLPLHGLNAFNFSQSVALDLCSEAYSILLNKEVWNSLPRDLQQLLQNESGEALSLQIATELDAAATAEKAKRLDNGQSIKELGTMEKSAWKELMAPEARSLWLQEGKAARLPVERFSKLIEGF